MTLDDRISKLENNHVEMNAKIDTILAGVSTLQALNSNLTLLKKHGPKTIWYICGFITALSTQSPALKPLAVLAGH